MIGRGKLRREDLLFLATLILNKNTVVLYSTLKEAMGRAELDNGNAVLQRSKNRLGRIASIDFIKNKRGLGYYLE